MMAKDEIRVLSDRGPVFIAINDEYIQSEKEIAKIMEKMSVVRQKFGLKMNTTAKNRVAVSTFTSGNIMLALSSVILELNCFEIIC